MHFLRFLYLVCGFGRHSLFAGLLGNGVPRNLRLRFRRGFRAEFAQAVMVGPRRAKQLKEGTSQ